MKTGSLFFISALLFFVSCHKEKSTPGPVTPPMVHSEYMPMKTGNYWIYQWFRTDTNGNQVTGKIDSVYISKDTLLNNKKYYCFEDPDGFIPQYITDSSGYLIAYDNTKILSPDINTVFYSEDDLYKRYSQQCCKDTTIYTPAGTFNQTLAYRILAVPKDSSLGGGNSYYIYAKGIGLVQFQSFFPIAPQKPIGRKLVRYKVN